MSLRYAILDHTGVPEPHYDLMFETAPGSPLATWRSPAWPITAPTQLDRLADHRRDYLDYEGPVSHGRGAVRRVAGGACNVDRADDDHWRISTPQGLHLDLHHRAGTLWTADVPPRA